MFGDDPKMQLYTLFVNFRSIERKCMESTPERFNFIRMPGRISGISIILLWAYLSYDENEDIIGKPLNR